MSWRSPLLLIPAIALASIISAALLLSVCLLDPTGTLQTVLVRPGAAIEGAVAEHVPEYWVWLEATGGDWLQRTSAMIYAGAVWAAIIAIFAGIPVYRRLAKGGSAPL